MSILLGFKISLLLLASLWFTWMKNNENFLRVIRRGYRAKMFAYFHDRDANSMHYFASFVSLNCRVALLVLFDVCSGRASHFFLIFNQ